MYFVQKPLRWLKAISRFGGTVTGAPNFAPEHCINRINAEDLDGIDLSSLRLFYFGAERVRPQTLKAFKEKFAPNGFDERVFYPCYGLAESTLISSAGTPGEGAYQHYHAGLEKDYVACGASIEGQALRVLHVETQAPCADLEVGELEISGPSIAAGYFNNPAETARMFSQQDATSAYARFKTGDLGFVYQGNVYITGRIKELIIIRGVNYYPQELEEQIEYCHDAIVPNGVACFSCEIDSVEQLIVRCEVKRAYRNDGGIQDACRKAVRLALAQNFDLTPYQIDFVPERALPKTPSGKIKRAQLRESFLQSPA